MGETKVNPAAPTQCTDEVMLHGFVDGELDAAHSLQIEQHIANCSHCSIKMEGLQALKRLVGQKGVQWRTPDHVRAQVLESISREAAMQTRSAALVTSETKDALVFWIHQAVDVRSIAGCFAASLLLVMTPMWDRPTIGDEVISGHIRSLLVDHLTDVATSIAYRQTLV